MQGLQVITPCSNQLLFWEQIRGVPSDTTSLRAPGRGLEHWEPLDRPAFRSGQSGRRRKASLQVLMWSGLKGTLCSSWGGT